MNVEPDLAHFGGIVPCGIAQSHYGVTSLVDLGLPIAMAEFDAVLRAEFERVFGPTAGSAVPGAPRAELADATAVAETNRTIRERDR